MSFIGPRHHERQVPMSEEASEQRRKKKIVELLHLAHYCKLKRRPPSSGTVIGTDLGATCSCVGVYRNGHVEITANDQGEAANNQEAVNPERTVFDWGSEGKLVACKIVNKDGKPCIQVKIKDEETKVFSPEEISAMFLTNMKETAESFLGKKIKDAVQLTSMTHKGKLQNDSAAIAHGLDKRVVKRTFLSLTLAVKHLIMVLLKLLPQMEILSGGGRLLAGYHVASAANLSVENSTKNQD
ncbi:Heat shock protein 70 family - like 8 [Theobroma cacao]|nr:Heat shock protein 70 family - like 8 [Theobroma cacao]